MPFDQEQYLGYRSIIDPVIRTRPWCYRGTVSEWIDGFIPMLSEYAYEGDYEAAKAIKDSITEYYEELTGEHLPINCVIRLSNRYEK